jgi:PAS domain S-box-containing protein
MSEESNTALAPEEAHQTLDAIASGNVDGIVVDGPHGPRVFRLEGPDEPFRTFVERMQEGALTLSAEGEILFANGYFAQLVQQTSERLIGAPLASFVPSRYHFTLATLIREGMEKPVKGQLRLCVGAITIPVQFTLSPLVGGTRPSCCAVMFDLREREQIEEAHAARVAAEQASTAKDQFLAILSHELRSPLNTMLGWAQILLNDGSLNERQQRAVQTIERSARTQAQLIADLLDISRIIAGKLSLERSNLELGALVESVLSAAKPTVEQKQLRVSARLAEDADVYGDSTRLHQIVTNLLNNALKFTEPGGSIDVTVEREESAVLLTVADTGIGMSHELVARVFDVFHQGETQPRRQGGLGLGLAIAKQLVEAHGGTLTATSPGEGLGSSFTVRLPRTNKSVTPPRPEFAPRGELHGVSALLIDDEPDSLELARYLLEAAGCSVAAVESAERALAALDERRFGLIVSDIGLGDQDGLELMREIRARGYGAADLPAIALTGYAGVHDARLIDAAGYQRHLTKPVDATLLVRTAAEVAARRPESAA